MHQFPAGCIQLANVDDQYATCKALLAGKRQAVPRMPACRCMGDLGYLRTDLAYLCEQLLLVACMYGCRTAQPGQSLSCQRRATCRSNLAHDDEERPETGKPTTNTQGKIASRRMPDYLCADICATWDTSVQISVQPGIPVCRSGMGSCWPHLGMTVRCLRHAAHCSRRANLHVAPFTTKNVLMRVSRSPCRVLVVLVGPNKPQISMATKQGSGSSDASGANYVQARACNEIP